MLFQAMAMLDGAFIAPAKRVDELGDMNLLDLHKQMVR